MSFQHCVDAKCLSRHFESRPEGHHPELPWLLSHECGTCSTTWFTCNGMCNARRTQNRSSRGLYKNMQQVRRHSKSHTASKNSPRTSVAISMENDVPGSLNDYLMEHEEVDKLSVDDRGNDGIVVDVPAMSDMECCELSSVVIEEDSLANLPDYTPNPTCDGDEVVEVEDKDLYQNNVSPRDKSEPLSSVQKFEHYIVQGKTLVAASFLVAQAAFQTTATPKTILPLPNIMLFLSLAKLVLSTGRLQLYNLSKVLSILYPYAHKLEKEWAPIPCTVSGFRSCILNVSNSNSLMSILPIPLPDTVGRWSRIHPIAKYP